MFRFLGNLPEKVAVACSGGVDSMAVLDFLVQGKRDVTVLHFNHMTPFGLRAEKFIKDYCIENALRLEYEALQFIGPPPGVSEEEHWRNARYNFFAAYSERHPDRPIVMAHHLDDVIEWWLFTALHGDPKLIPYSRPDCNIVRPFLANPKFNFIHWAEKHEVPYVQDPTNGGIIYGMRNRIRSLLVPQALVINPGLAKVLKKKIIIAFNESNGKHPGL